MAFIPIIANADIANDDNTLTSTSKKGKITPTQMSQIFSWALEKKVGILDCLNKCLAENEVYTFNDNVVTINLQPGFISIYGHIIENTGSAFVFDRTIYTANNGAIVLSVDLGSVGKEEYKIDVKQIQNGNLDLKDQNLNENPKNGKYDFVLYRYSISTNTLKLMRYETQTPYIRDFPSVIIDILNSIKSNKEDIIGTGMTGAGNAPLQDYDKTKGTIEERLTALGFKEGNLASPYSEITLKKQGKFAILQTTKMITLTMTEHRYVEIPLKWADNDFVISNEDISMTIQNVDNYASSIILQKNSNVATIYVPNLAKGGSTSFYSFSIGFEIL